MLGRPVAHSLSPLLHRAAYAELGLDWSYEAVDVGADELAGFLDGLADDWAGLSLTMPLKSAVLPLLDDVAPLAAAVAAVNTVVLRDGRRAGHNTDVHGVEAALREAGVVGVRRGAVVGGGATARSALAALAALGERRPVLVVRSHPADTLAASERLGVEPTLVPYSPEALAGCDVVVSTVPAAASADVAAALSDGLAAVDVLLDAVYDPWPTPLGLACRGTVVGGDRMLLHQAAAQVELMTGLPAPLEAMAAALADR